MTNEGYVRLSIAIIDQAAQDYRTALRGGVVDNKAPKDTIAECERFFRSPFFNILTNIDGEYFITRIRKEINK